MRQATEADLDDIVEVLVSAFVHDPLWGPVFPDPALRPQHADRFWRLFASSAQRYPSTFVVDADASREGSGGIAAVAVWIPPGGTELSEAEGEAFEELITEATDAATAARVITISHAIEDAHPSEPHHYLSWLGTHGDARGTGVGMSLLRQTLALVDAEGAAAYLESSNPANLARYASVGFEPRTAIEMSTGDIVTTMWRPAR